MEVGGFFLGGRSSELVLNGYINVRPILLMEEIPNNHLYMYKTRRKSWEKILHIYWLDLVSRGYSINSMDTPVDP